ncbi:MAG TPA: phosphatase PAP2 family protein [Methylocella sp.]|nr:phosphatase PAP2 family protein [Methylocella sp.]
MHLPSAFYSRARTGTVFIALLSAALLTVDCCAQTPTNLVVLKGLAPLTILLNSPEGKAALAANYAVTGAIQTGALHQPTPLPFPDQQQQALKDAFITNDDLADLADGLGTTLGAAYEARAHYLDSKHFTSVSQAVSDLIAYTNATTRTDSNVAKYFFANATTDGKKAASNEAAAILKSIGGIADIYGNAYGHPAGTPGADRYGNSRPFQTEPVVAPITGPDYFNVPADNTVYTRGPVSNLIDSPSYPSGHTIYAYEGALVLALLVPERYQAMIARAAEYGNDRIVVSAHYAMDVIAGRTLAIYDLAHLLANDPSYVGQTLKDAPVIRDYQAAVKVARAEVRATLQAGCGNEVPVCAQEDNGRFNNSGVNEAFTTVTQSYGLPVVYPQNAETPEDVGQLTPEAGYLLTIAFPSLSLEQADQILTETEGPGGGFLDNGSPFGVYSRLDLYAAAGKAAKLASGKAATLISGK